MNTEQRDYPLGMIVSKAFPELGLVVREPTVARQDLLQQRTKGRAEVLETLAITEAPGEALEILSAWRQRRKAFDL